MVRSQPPALLEVDTPPLATANPPVPLFTYREIAKLAKVGLQTVYEWVRTGRVPSPIYNGSTARFTEGHLMVILHDRKKPGAYPVQPSPRAEVGKLAAVAKKKKHAKKVRKPRARSMVFALTDLIPPKAKTKDRAKRHPKGKPAKKTLPAKTRVRKSVCS